MIPDVQVDDADDPINETSSEGSDVVSVDDGHHVHGVGKWTT